VFGLFGLSANTEHPSGGAMTDAEMTAYLNIGHLPLVDYAENGGWPVPPGAQGARRVFGMYPNAEHPVVAQNSIWRD
jgi:hypothetical protein